MTLPEAQTIRTAILAAISTVAAGGVAEYGINNRRVTKLDITKLLSDLNDIDALIDRLSNGMFSVVQFRPGSTW